MSLSGPIKVAVLVMLISFFLYVKNRRRVLLTLHDFSAVINGFGQLRIESQANGAPALMVVSACRSLIDGGAELATQGEAMASPKHKKNKKSKP